jgi:CPW-WPC domain-containing protein
MALRTPLLFSAAALAGLFVTGEALQLRSRGLPTFPDGTAEGVVAMGNSFQDNKGPKKDEQPLINKLKENAEQVLEEQVAQGLRSGQTAKAAYLLAHQNVVKQIYIGGCPRAYSKACPKGWSESAGGCEPPEEYTGPCAPTSLAGFSAADKEDFSWRCLASWPCENACKKDFSSCPSGWTQAGGGACAAPSDYDGICSPKTSFATFSDARKAEWAAMCSANWYSSALSGRRELVSYLRL